MTDAKRRIQRQELMDRMTIINERIKSHLSQAQRADTHFDACTHYADIQELAKTAQTKARRVIEDGKVMKVLLEQKHGLPGCVQPAVRG